MNNAKIIKSQTQILSKNDYVGTLTEFDFVSLLVSSSDLNWWMSDSWAE